MEYPAIKPNYIADIQLPSYNNTSFPGSYKGLSEYKIPLAFNTSNSTFVLKYQMRSLSTAQTFRQFWLQHYTVKAFTIPDIIFDCTPVDFKDFFAKNIGVRFRFNDTFTIMPKIINKRFKLYDFNINIISVVA